MPDTYGIKEEDVAIQRGHPQPHGTPNMGREATSLQVVFTPNITPGPDSSD
jgi:hypothetical protein